MFHAVGIGDLHLDGKLGKYIEGYNELIIANVRRVLSRAQRKAMKWCVLYGDVCDTSSLSDEALQLLLKLFCEFADMRFLVISGNHDRYDPSKTSLDSLRLMCELRLLKNVRVATSPMDILSETDHPVRLLPWPATDTLKTHLNVLHVEALGAKWDTGRDVTEGLDTRHLCVIGHIHTAQRVRNMHFAGTLYQTNFGEAPEKFFHEITWTGDSATSSVELVKFKPNYRLENVVLKTMEDYDTFLTAAADIDPAQAVYYKVFVNTKTLLLDAGAFDKAPGVIRINNFATKAELKVLMDEELDLAHEASVQFSTESMLDDWMRRNEIDSDLQKRALAKLAALTSRPR